TTVIAPRSLRRSFHSSRPHSRYSTYFALLTWPLTSISVQRTTAPRATSPAPAASAICLVRISPFAMVLPSLEHGRPLLKKRLDALLGVVAQKRGSTRGLNGLDLVGAHGGALVQAVQLGLDDRNRQRRAAGDRLRDFHRRRLQLLGTDETIEQPETIGVFGREGIAREDHLFDDVQG